MAKNKKSVLLIQPHSDDVLFSASKFLFNRKKYDKVIIYTVENDEKRLDEDRQLVDLYDIKLLHGKLHSNDKTYYEYYNVRKYKEFSYEDSELMLKAFYGKQYLKNLKQEIVSVAQNYKDKGFEIVTCLGIGHPIHWFVRKCLEDLADFFYRDFPHSYKRKTLNCVKDTLQEFKLKETFVLTEEENTLKFAVAYNVYKTQRSLLFFEKGYIDKNIPEEFYVKI